MLGVGQFDCNKTHDQRFGRKPILRQNSIHVRQGPRITPAIAAGVTPKLWSLTDMVRVIEDWEIARSLKISGKTMVG
jgi:hypothetical protein